MRASCLERIGDCNVGTAWLNSRSTDEVARSGRELSEFVIASKRNIGTAVLALCLASPAALAQAPTLSASLAGQTPSRYIVQALIDHCGIAAEPLAYTFERSSRLAKSANKKAVTARKVPVNQVSS